MVAICPKHKIEVKEQEDERGTLYFCPECHAYVIPQEGRVISDEEALESVNTLILYCRQNPDWFGRYEGSLLSLEEDLKN